MNDGLNDLATGNDYEHITGDYIMEIMFSR